MLEVINKEIKEAVWFAMVDLIKAKGGYPKMTNPVEIAQHLVESGVTTEKVYQIRPLVECAVMLMMEDGHTKFWNNNGYMNVGFSKKGWDFVTGKSHTA